MNEEKARSDAEALASALGIVFYIVRSADGQFSAVQQPTPECEIIAAVEPRSQRSPDDVWGFGDRPKD
jgi:hypothetical protein